MNIHNNILKAALITLTACMTTGCSDFLKEEPESNIGPEQVGDSEDAVDLWVTGVYSNWLYDMFCWNQFPAVLELDNDYISGPDWLFGYLGAGNFNGDSNIEKMWTGPYNLINDANIAIRYIRQMSNVDEDYKNNAIGEMLFQKAFSYFLLVRAFGPVPYYETDVQNGEEYYKPRESVDSIYKNITRMLEESVTLMYSRNDARYKTGHVNAGSAAGLLAKVYATMGSASMPAGTQISVRTGEPYETATNIDGDEVRICKVPTAHTFEKDTVAGYTEMDPMECYEKAAYWAKRVIDGEFGIYELADYSKLWDKGYRDASEFMWAIRSVSGEEKYCTGIHTYFSGYTESATSDYLVSGGWIGNTNNWYQLFDEDDYRVQYGVRHTWRYYYQESYDGCFFYPQSWKEKVTGYDQYGNYTGNQEEQYAQTGYNYHYNTDYECLAFTTKYDDVENKATQYADSNYPFLRYADVLLIYAEAMNETGDQQTAMKYLNTVRKRSNAKLMETTGTQTSMRSAILEERAKELACEGDRRWDIIRWGIYLQAMNAIGGRDDSDVYKERTKRNLLYPIPTTEINANPYIKTNNYGW